MFILEKEGTMEKSVLAIYLVDLMYGGPLPRGWWYETGVIMEDSPVYVCYSDTGGLEEEESKAREKLNKYIKDHGLNDGRPRIDSVLSRGRYVVRVETGVTVPPKTYLSTTRDTNNL